MTNGLDLLGKKVVFTSEEDVAWSDYAGKEATVSKVEKHEEGAELDIVFSDGLRLTVIDSEVELVDEQ